jgi:hypothetical protein
VRDEAGDHINAIQRDLQATLPPLLKVADEAPESISKVLPACRNIDALYDVLLSVVEAARVSAPGDQIDQLVEALTSLGKARLALSNRLQGVADALEKQVSDLRTTLQAQAAVRCPATPPPVAPTCAPPAAARKVKKKPKPPAATPQTSPAPAATTPKSGS